MSAMPIVLTKNEWDRIVKWTDTNKEDPETARRRKYLAYLDEKSAEMTKSWPNSLENVNKRNEEVRRARIESQENANARFYKRYVRRMKEEQERMMYSARDTIFKNKDAPKLLLSAVVESVILKEREEQIKFHNEVSGAYEREQIRLNDEMIIRKAKEWHELQKQKKRARFAANKQHQKDLLDQIHEIEENNRKGHEEEMRQQRLDIINSNKEIAAIKEFEINYKEAERKRIWKDNTQSLKEAEHRRQEQAARDKMDDQLLQVLLKSQCSIEAKRRATEKEILAEKLRVLEAITKKLKNTTGARDAKEQACLEKAVKERNEQVEARHKATLDKLARFKREKIETRNQYLRDEAQREHEEHTMKLWGIMNRFKNQELYEDYKEKLRLEKERKTKEFREDMLRQKKEVDDRNAKERAETRHFYGKLAEQKFRQADNKLLTHAQALLAEARHHGRPTFPIEKAIDRYCKLYRLYPMPSLPASLAEHSGGYAPWDGSAPDAGYSEPPPPPPASDPDAHADEPEPAPPEPAKRDGLQPLAKAPGPKPSCKPKESQPKEGKPCKDKDYRRQGPANGMQTKPEEIIVLPPITVVTYPCKKLGIVSNLPLKKEQCECAVIGEI